MKREQFTTHSTYLGRDMHAIAYGEAGAYPVVAVPTQDAMADEWEGFGMVGVLAPLIDAGRIQLFCVDTVDHDSWTDGSGDDERRAATQEAYYDYLVEELLAEVHERNASEVRPLAVGCDLGATQAALLALRRPDLFQGCVALSGLYRTSRFFGDWMNDTLYDNDICTFLSNMEPTHPYVRLYNERQLVFCVGQGAWEDSIDDLRVISEEFDRLGVGAWCDFWGFDVSHDWPWWKRQIAYFLPIVLDQASAQAEAGEKDAGPAGEGEPGATDAEAAGSGTAGRRAGEEESLRLVKEKGARRFAPAQGADDMVGACSIVPERRKGEAPLNWIAEG